MSNDQPTANRLFVRHRGPGCDVIQPTSPAGSIGFAKVGRNSWVRWRSRLSVPHVTRITHVILVVLSLRGVSIRRITVEALNVDAPSMSVPASVTGVRSLAPQSLPVGPIHLRSARCEVVVPRGVVTGRHHISAVTLSDPHVELQD